MRIEGPAGECYPTLAEALDAACLKTWPDWATLKAYGLNWQDYVDREGFSPLAAMILRYADIRVLTIYSRSKR